VAGRAPQRIKKIAPKKWWKILGWRGILPGTLGTSSIGKGEEMGSYSVYKMLRPSAKNGTRLRIHVEWATSRAQAIRRADEIQARACPEVQAVEVVDHCAGDRVVYRASSGELIAS
jgi:hypothetical protein